MYFSKIILENFMVYGYIRVSTDRQTVENQRYEINKFCKKNILVINKWIEETISGATEVEKRKLGELLNDLQKGDILICSEISRLGRNLFMVMAILNVCMAKEVQVWSIKDNYRLGNDINSKVLAFAFGLSAEIERNLNSQRTKEALARAKSEGIQIGRQKGSKNKVAKLTGKDEIISRLLGQGISKAEIARQLSVSRTTIFLYFRKLKAISRSESNLFHTGYME
jgi:DNA invertase Pin-like site-specific DNA recombinase